MAPKKRIGVDLDNTLINYEEVFRSFASDAIPRSPQARRPPPTSLK